MVKRRTTLKYSITSIAVICVAALLQGCPGNLEGPYDRYVAAGGGQQPGVGNPNPVNNGVGVNSGVNSGGGPAVVGPTLTFNSPRPGTCTDLHFVGQVGGVVLGENGQPIAGAKAQLCVYSGTAGVATCLSPADSQANGHFVIDLPATSQCLNEAALRIFLPGVDMSTVYCDLALPAGRSAVSLTQPLVLHATTRPASLPPEGDPLQSRTVTFADGLQIDIVPDEFFSTVGGYEDLAVRRLDPSTSNLCFINNPPAIHGVYAFSPEGDIDVGYTMRVPNTTGLPAGSQVALYVLGGLTCTLPDESHVPEGVWTEYGTGTVSGDGSVIEAAGPGSSVPCLGWFGYGPK